MSKAKPYPTWVCNECADPLADYMPALATFHIGKCDVCGKMKPVTEPRDYGYPKFAGHKDAYTS